MPTPNVSLPGASSAMTGELPRDRHRVAQRKQIQPDIHRQVLLKAEQRCRCDQPVRTRADKKADVIADTDVVNALIGSASQRRTVLGSRLSERQERPDPNGTHAS